MDSRISATRAFAVSVSWINTLTEFTGERLIPGQVDVDLYNEHMARYTFAVRLARGKTRPRCRMRRGLRQRRSGEARAVAGWRASRFACVSLSRIVDMTEVSQRWGCCLFEGFVKHLHIAGSRPIPGKFLWLRSAPCRNYQNSNGVPNSSELSPPRFMRGHTGQ
jgi:hypothetical protein